MKLHHVAYVCRNIEQKAEYYTSFLQAKKVGQPVVDEQQGVRIQFLEFDDGGLVELLEPSAKNSPVQRFLDKGGGLYHLCFRVNNLEKTLEEVTRDGRAFVVKPPLAAPAIDNRRVAFVVSDHQELIEFVEKAT